jgi:hypothetical protein
MDRWLSTLVHRRNEACVANPDTEKDPSDAGDEQWRSPCHRTLLYANVREVA